MKNVLFLLDYYLPDASANGVCIEGIVDELTNNGVNVSILALGDQTETITDNHIRIYKFQEPPKKKAIRGLSALGFYVKWLLPSRYPIKNRNSLVQLYVEKSRDIIIRDQIDTIVSVHLPIETLVAGSILRKEFKDIKMIAYMLDSMSGGHIPRFIPSRFTRWRKRRWENTLFVSFDRIVLMESSRKHHEGNRMTDKWIDKAYFLNVPLLIRRTTAINKIAKTDNQKVQIAFCGLLDYPYRNVLYLIDVVQMMKTNVELILVGKSNIKDRLFAISQNNDKVSYMGQLPHTQVKQVLESADILLNLGVKTPSAISGKIFEYMSYMKPIVITYSIDDEACLPYIKNYPLSLALDEREADVKTTANLLDHFISDMIGNKAEYAILESVFYSSTPKAFCDFLINLK